MNVISKFVLIIGFQFGVRIPLSMLVNDGIKMMDFILGNSFQKNIFAQLHYTYNIFNVIYFTYFIFSSFLLSLSLSIDETRIWNNPYNGMVRLVNGDFSNEGRLEVYCSGQWGTVCDNSFGSTDGLTACEQLGYNRIINTDYKSE